MKKTSTKKGAAFKERAVKAETPPFSMLAVAEMPSPVPAKKSSKKSQNKDNIRQIYLENREREISLFESSLREVQLKAPSVGGKIVGMDFQQFSAITVFNTIIDQEEYIHSKSPYVNPEEEKKLLEKFIKQAKEVFGDQYDTWYNHCKNF